MKFAQLYSSTSLQETVQDHFSWTKASPPVVCPSQPLYCFGCMLRRRDLVVVNAWAVFCATEFLNASDIKLEASNRLPAEIKPVPPEACKDLNLTLNYTCRGEYMDKNSDFVHQQHDEWIYILQDEIPTLCKKKTKKQQIWMFFCVRGNEFDRTIRPKDKRKWHTDALFVCLCHLRTRK